MNYDALVDGLQTDWLGRPLYLFRETDSTNRVALRMGKFRASEGTAVVADYQTAGRGRRARQWLAPPGTSILCSFIVRPSVSLAADGPLATGSETWYTLLTALSIAKSIEQLTALKAQVKWPNDVWIQGRKICGILTEYARDQAEQPYYVIGFGINVNFPRDGIPFAIRDTATALNLLLGFEVSRVDLFLCALCEIEARIEEFRVRGPDQLHRELERRSFLLRRRIWAETYSGRIEGNASGFAEDGSLLIQQDDQRIVQLHAGDVHLARDFSSSLTEDGSL